MTAAVPASAADEAGTIPSPLNLVAAKNFGGVSHLGQRETRSFGWPRLAKTLPRCGQRDLALGLASSRAAERERVAALEQFARAFKWPRPPHWTAATTPARGSPIVVGVDEGEGFLVKVPGPRTGQLNATRAFGRVHAGAANRRRFSRAT